MLPAIYFQLNRAELLHYLPKELVNFMEHIVSLNKDRNASILEQCSHLDKILRENGIEPIFLKGTGLILQQMYQNSAERMIGDIDILVSPTQIESAAEVLKQHGYANFNDSTLRLPNTEKNRHLERFIHPNKIAAIEVHRFILRNQDMGLYRYSRLEKDSINFNSKKFLGLQDQLIYAVTSKQINDYGRSYLNFDFRSIYDSLKLTERGVCIPDQQQKLGSLVTDYLCFANILLNDSLKIYPETYKSKKYVKLMEQRLSGNKYLKFKVKKRHGFNYLKARTLILIKAISNPEIRTWLWLKAKNLLK